MEAYPRQNAAYLVVRLQHEQQEIRSRISAEAPDMFAGIHLPPPSFYAPNFWVYRALQGEGPMRDKPGSQRFALAPFTFIPLDVRVISPHLPWGWAHAQPIRWTTSVGEYLAVTTGRGAMQAPPSRLLIPFAMRESASAACAPFHAILGEDFWVQSAGQPSGRVLGWQPTTATMQVCE
jgi:hypothetical protein